MRRTLLILLVVTVVPLALWGCGSSDSASLETYLSQIRQGVESFVAANNSGADAVNPDSTAAESLAGWKAFADGYRSAYSQLSAVTPPDGLANAHNDWTAAIAAQADSAAQTATAIERYMDSGSDSDLKAFKDAYNQASADQRGIIDSMSTWSTELSDQANDHGLEVPAWMKDLVSQVDYRNSP